MHSNIQFSDELVNRFRLDQALSREKRWKELEEVYHKNSIWLKQIMHQNILQPTGEKEELCMWLIVQHSDDLLFQKEFLGYLKELPNTRERRKSIAHLTDKILVKENKKQIYGTQFLNGKPHPIEDEINLDNRRMEMGLELFSSYYKLMSQ